MFASVDAQRCTVAAAYSIAGLCCFNAVPDKYGFFIVFVPELVYHKLGKTAKCLFSSDKALKRALIVIKFKAEADDSEKFRFQLTARVELQMSEEPPEDDEAKNNMIRDELVPFADKIVSDKAQEIVKSLGYPMIGFDSEGT